MRIPRKHVWVSYGGARFRVCFDCGVVLLKGRLLPKRLKQCAGSRAERVEKYASEDAR